MQIQIQIQIQQKKGKTRHFCHLVLQIINPWGANLFDWCNLDFK